MDPALIDAEDKHRAKRGSLRSPDFRRMVRLAWPHRRFITVGLLASVVYGFLHSVSVLGALPVLKVLLADEGFHGWVYRSVAEERLGVTFEADLGGSLETLSGEQSLRLAEVDAQSPLAAHDLRAGDGIVAVDGQHATPLEVLETLARGPTAIDLTIRYLDRERHPEGDATVSVALGDASWRWRRLADVAGFVPPVRERGDRLTTLVYVLCFVIMAVVLSNVARFVAQYYTAMGVLRAVMDLRRMLYSKVLRLPMDFFTQHTSDIVSRFVQDAQEIQRGLMSLFGKLLREPIKAIFLLVAALMLDARMTFTMLLVAPAVSIIFWYVGRKIRRANKRLLRAYGLMIGALTTTLDAIGIVKAYNAEHTERKHLWQIDRKTFRYQLRIAKLEAILHPTLEVLGVLAITGVTLWLGARVLDQRIRLEDFGGLVLVLGMLIDPLRKVADVYPRIMRSAAGARRIFSVVDAPAEEELEEGAIELQPPAQGIEFRGVTYTYPNAPEPALNEVSVKIAAGETVAIVGPNGSGKTTLTKMLLRFHDPQAGQVLFDGADIRTATLRSLRKRISLVSQDPVVFAMTVAENIGYGVRHADRQSVEDAARRAHAEDFIAEKADAFDEMIGVRGSTLSGGQRQRLCIARAILRDAPILIFDEATSQIDSESERKIQHSLSELAKGRTTFIVAHRLSTIRFASRIIVMDKGRILDTGTHEELSQRCSLYAALCQTQLGE